MTHVMLRNGEVTCLFLRQLVVPLCWQTRAQQRSGFPSLKVAVLSGRGDITITNETSSTRKVLKNYFLGAKATDWVLGLQDQCLQLLQLT